MSALDDLRLGVKFAVNGGREGWTRTLLTAVGVGLGVALLLITSAIPSALAARDHRSYARGEMGGATAEKAGQDTLLITSLPSGFRDRPIEGRLVQPEGPEAPLPPGLTAFPAPGALAVSPALKELMDSGEGKLLRERLNGPVTAVIADAGLMGPHELFYYQGSKDLGLNPGTTKRITSFQGIAQEGLDPILLLLVLVACVVLLIPVAVLIAAAVRFGGERRDRRLAALRLVGADATMTRRIAAGEALAGALAGLAVGGALFFVVRSMAGLITMERISVFPADLSPVPWVALLICLAVPVSAVLVTLLALRGVVIEPLGVVRTAKPVRRRLWWRLLLPVAGLALLLPLLGKDDENEKFNEPQVIGGTALLLIGVTALLPWLVEAVVARLGKGPVSWQLAVRRLQLSSGTAARTVNGVAVAVAGAIALQMLLSGIDGQYTKDTGVDASLVDMSLHVYPGTPGAARAEELTKRLTGTAGVQRTLTVDQTTLGDHPKEPENYTDLTVADCTTLRIYGAPATCKNGDVYLTGGKALEGIPAPAAEGFKPGHRYYLSPATGPAAGLSVPWTLPVGTTTVDSRKGPEGFVRGGILATPDALPAAARSAYVRSVYLKFDGSEPYSADLARNAAYATDPSIYVSGLLATKTDNRFAQIQRGLFAGATCVLLLIGASLLVTQLEQLRERKKLLAALVAFGTRRSTLGWSVLWQAAVPVALGLALAIAVGLLLGTVLLRMTAVPITVDWGPIAIMSAIAGGVILLVTALSMPVLLRLMRPTGLRTE
ncbi:ABC transporter permease [Streptomyces sp. CA-294286]|uniref:ABC transporter permease n=1 Tax=Streptomyces sp. CA-294286 TaxID=3240070 RepID=UPI003D93A612